MQRIAACFSGALILLVPQAGAFAQDKVSGEREYQSHCVVCHGADGKGNGPYAELLKVSLPDLTTLAKRNGGVFPAERVASVIDGREVVAAHGTRDMPIWGYEYSKSAIDYWRDFYGKADADAFVKRRVDELSAYLKSLQK